MNKFLLKLLLIFITFLLFPLSLYVIFDPYKVIYKYPEQINTDKKYLITGNRDFQSTQLFLWNYKKYNYNSFIFGNSRSMFYQVNTWNKFIQGNCFHFNASVESIYGINYKLELLDKLKVNIKNALIILDQSTLINTKNSKGHLFIKHPILTKKSYLTFHLEMFKAFYSKAFFAFMDLYLTGKRKNYMSKFGIINNIWKHDMKSNQATYYVYDQLLQSNPNLYYAQRKNIFYTRDTIQKFSKQSIFKAQEILLENIHSILKIHKTNYKIIISPLYDQIKINQKDLDYLRSLFGAENVYDFSGINIITNDYHNYYENSHYRPHITDYIMKEIYK